MILGSQRVENQIFHSAFWESHSRCSHRVQLRLCIRYPPESAPNPSVLHFINGRLYEDASLASNEWGPGKSIFFDAIFIRYFLKCMERKQPSQKSLAPRPAGAGGGGGGQGDCHGRLLFLSSLVRPKLQKLHKCKCTTMRVKSIAAIPHTYCIGSIFKIYILLF